MRFAKHLYRAARLVNTVEAVASGDSKRVGRRAGNIVKGRVLARTGFWNLLWGAKR